MKWLEKYLPAVVLVLLAGSALALTNNASLLQPSKLVPNPRADDTQRTTALLANMSEDLRPKVVAVIRDQQKRLGGCQELSRLDAEQIWVLDKIDFYDSGKPARGRWQVRYDVTLCGEQVTRNVVFEAGHSEREATDDGIAIEAKAPGGSLADPQLSADVWHSFQLVAAKAWPSCKTPVIKETRVINSPIGPHNLWRELWVGRLCDRDLAQVVTFYPTQQGTMFRMVLPDKAIGSSGNVSVTDLTVTPDPVSVTTISTTTTRTITTKGRR